MSGGETTGRADAELVREALSGSEAAYRELMERYAKRAYGVAVGIVGDPDEAQDVVQEAFIKAYYSLREFRFGSNFYTWFYRLLVNRAIDRWRKTARSKTVPMDESWLRDDGSAPDGTAYPRTPEEMAENRQLSEALARAIGSLPEYHRAVILLREVEGMSYEEIAKSLGCSVGTVMSRLHYARAKLRDALGEFREG